MVVPGGDGVVVVLGVSWLFIVEQDYYIVCSWLCLNFAIWRNTRSINGSVNSCIILLRLKNILPQFGICYLFFRLVIMQLISINSGKSSTLKSLDMLYPLALWMVGQLSNLPAMKCSFRRWINTKSPGLKMTLVWCLLISFCSSHFASWCVCGPEYVAT